MFSGLFAKKVKPEDPPPPPPPPPEPVIPRPSTSTHSPPPPPASPPPNPPESKTEVRPLMKNMKKSVAESVLDISLLNLRDTVKYPSKDEDGKEMQLLQQVSHVFMGHIYVNDDRPKWEGKFDCLVTMLGFSLSLSSVWRLPYLCYKHKGICFLIPYFIMVVICGVPLLYLEFILGQFLQEGPVGMWKVCPIFKGCGYAMLFVTYIVSYTYNVYVTWMVLYFVASLTPPPDFVNCTFPWNSGECIPVSPDLVSNTRNGTLAGCEYFNGYILKSALVKTQRTTTINLGPPDKLHVAYFSCIYILFGIFMVRGMQNSVKIMLLSTALPSIILGMMAFRGATLRGSSTGIQFLFQAECFQSFLYFETWLDAASQVIYSIGVGFGVHVSIASLIPFNTKTFKNALIVAASTVVTSLIAIMVIFTFLGAVAFITRKEMTEIEFDEQNVLFNMLPNAIGLMPSSSFFALCFYFMLFALTFSCEVAGMHSVVLSLRDAFGSYGHSRRFRSCIILTVTLVSFYAVGILSLAKGGHFFLYAVEDFIASSALLICAATQTIGICWFYGVDNVCRAEYAMNGIIPPIFFRICWKFVSPLILLILLFGELIKNAPTTKMNKIGDIQKLIGYIVGLTPLIIIIIVGLVQLLRVSGPKKLLCLISPEIEHERIRTTGMAARACKRHWNFVGTRKQMEEIFPHFKDSIEEQDEKTEGNIGKRMSNVISVVASGLFDGIQKIRRSRSKGSTAVHTHEDQVVSM